MVSQIVNVTVGLLMFRVGPQEMPGRQQALLIVLGSYLAVALTICRLLGFSWSESLAEVFWALSMLWLFVWAVLKLSGKAARLLQTFTAILACDVVFEILKFAPGSILVPWMRELQAKMATMDIETASATVDTPAGAFMIVLLIFGWSIAVMAHVFRHALEIRQGQALMIAALYPLMFMVLMVMLAGGGGV